MSYRKLTTGATVFTKNTGGYFDHTGCNHVTGILEKRYSPRFTGKFALLLVWT